MHHALVCPDLWERVYLPDLVDAHCFLLFRCTCRQTRDLPITQHTLAKVLLPNVPDIWLRKVCEANPRLSPSGIAHVVKTVLFPEVQHWPLVHAPAVYARMAQRFFDPDTPIVRVAYVCTGLAKPLCRYHMVRTMLAELAQSDAGRQRLLSAADLMNPTTVCTELTHPSWRCRLELFETGIRRRGRVCYRSEYIIGSEL